MFNQLREELNKIALMEEDELEMMDTGDVIDDGAADDELYDDVDEDSEELEDRIVGIGESADPETIDAIVESIVLMESEDDYDYDDYDYYNEDEDYDDDDDEYDGVIGDGSDDALFDDYDDEEDDEFDSDIDGITNSIHEDVDEDFEEEFDDLLEAMCDGVHADMNDIYGDSSDMPDGDIPPSPQYQKLMHRRNASGKEFVDFGNANYQKYGKVFLDKELMNHMTVDDEAYDDEGNEYDLYASAGNIYDDDENEEFYGIRNRVSTNTLFGKHENSNINAGRLRDRYGNNEEALDESVASFLANYME